MTTRKIKDLDELPQCDCPEHNPPTHMVFSPGMYEHICPLCQNRIEFVIHKIMTTNSILPTLEVPIDIISAKKLTKFANKCYKVFANISYESENLTYYVSPKERNDWINTNGNTAASFDKEKLRTEKRLQNSIDDLETFVIEFLKK